MSDRGLLPREAACCLLPTSLRGRFPGFRVNAPSLEPSPSFGLEWQNDEKRLSGYSGGTAQVFDLLPFYPPFMEAP